GLAVVFHFPPAGDLFLCRPHLEPDGWLKLSRHRPDQRFHLPSVAGRARQQAELFKLTLVERNISKTCWDFTQTHSLRISRYSDSLEGRGLRFALPLHSQRLPYRLVARPQSTRRSFADYGDWRSGARFFLGKLTTAQERNACRREEAGRDLITVV